LLMLSGGVKRPDPLITAEIVIASLNGL